MIQRFTFTADDMLTGCCLTRRPDDDGAYVLHSDLAASQSRAERLADILNRLVTFIDNEGPASKEWAAITAICEEANIALTNDAGEGA